MRSVTILFLALLVAGAAVAEDGPEATDPSGDARLPDPCLDLVGARVATDDAGNVTLRVLLAGCPAAPTDPGLRWFVEFRDATARYFAYASWDAAGSGCTFRHGWEEGNSTFDRNDDVPGFCEIVAGEPAEVRIPVSPVVMTVAPGGNLTLLRVESAFVDILFLDGVANPTTADAAKVVRDHVRPAPAPQARTEAPPVEAPSEEVAPTTVSPGAKETPGAGAATVGAILVALASTRSRKRT